MLWFLKTTASHAVVSYIRVKNTGRGVPVVFYTNVKNHSIPTQWFFTSTCACAGEEEEEPRRAMGNHTARVGKQMYL